jgi:hypothetical protein
MTLRQTTRVCLAVLALCLPAAQAQAQAQGTGPIGPVGPIRQGGDSTPQRQLPVPAARGLDLEPGPLDSSPAKADTHTLSSIEMLGIGSLGVVRSFLDPSFRFNQSGDTGIVPGTNNSVTSMGMNLRFERTWSGSRIAGSYDGAQVFHYPNSSYNTMRHNLAVSQEFHWARWVLRLRDDLVISPEASFGGLDTGGANSLVGLQPSTGVNDTILTQRAKRLNDTASGEINYSLSRRSTMTFAGSYTSLTFTNAGLIDSHGVSGRFGYDYAVAPKDSIGFMYNYTRTNFGAASPLMQTDMVQLSYGRKVTGRLAFQISAGPQLVRSGSLSRTLSWSLSSATTYQTRRAQYSLSYSHGFSSGSGVFSGAENHTVTAVLGYTLTRSWSTSLGGGYALNRAIATVAGVNNFFGTWYGTASLGRGIGRHVHVGLNYGFQQQSAGSGTCPVSACGSTQLRQTLGITMELHPWSMSSR